MDRLRARDEAYRQQHRAEGAQRGALGRSERPRETSAGPRSVRGARAERQHEGTRVRAHVDDARTRSSGRSEADRALSSRR